jgi:MFS family permease
MRDWFARIGRSSRAIKLFIAYTLLANIGLGVFQLIYNLYLVRLGYREDFIGTISAVTTVCVGVAALAMGPLTNRFGSWRCILFGLTTISVALLGQALFTNPTLLIISAALTGVGQAGLIVPNMPFIIDHTADDERADLSAIVFSVMSLSMTGGSLIGGRLPELLGFLGNDFGSGAILTYRATLVAGIVLTLCGLLPLALIGGGQRGPAIVSGQLLGADRLPRRVRSDMLVFVAVGGLFSISAAAIVPFYAVYLQELGAQPSLIGTIFALSGAVGAVVGVFAPPLARRYGVLAVAAGARFIGVPLFILLLFMPGLNLAFLAYIIRAVGMTLAWPIDSNLISEVLPARQRATVFSLRSASWNCSWALASFAVGKLIVTTGSYNVVFITSSLFALLALVLFTLYFWRHPRIIVERDARRALKAGARPARRATTSGS